VTLKCDVDDRSAAYAAWDKWVSEHEPVATREGWVIRDRAGSWGWQIESIDQSDKGCTQLDDDDDAWRVVLEGQQPHHVTAREFMRRFGRTDYYMFLSSLQLDATKLDEQTTLDAVLAKLRG
jgi:hypothetical protein